MKRYNMVKAKQGGFVGVIFLAIALIAIVMVAIAYMSRSSTSGVSDQGAKTNASVLLKQSADFKSGFDRLLVSGTVTPTQVTWDTTPVTGLFDPAAGYAILQTPPAAAQSTPQPYTYSKLVTLAGVGTGAADNVLTLGNLTLAVCQQINKALFNDLVAAAPPATTATTAQWTTAPSAIADGTGGKSGRSEGCVGTSDGGYVYYKAMNEN